MRVHILGSGTSQGVPVVGCTCEVCTSNDPRDTRLRSSILLEKDDFHLLIDMTPDFRQQMLRLGCDRVDAILVTHEHQDHVSGLDDVRPINFKWNMAIPLYTLERVLGELRRRFYYAFEEDYPGKPHLTPHVITFGEEIWLGPFHIKAVRVDHGALPILGYIIDGKLAYLTDCKTLPEDTWTALKSCDTVIMSALHRRYHHAHQDLEEALAKSVRLRSKEVLFTHVSHEMGRYEDICRGLPDHVRFVHDSMILEC